AVLLVKTTAPEDIAAYGIRVVDQWKLGREDLDDGVLFLVALDDRRMRIEVGYGLEGAIPDARAKQIIDGIVAPQFREGRIFAGIEAGTDAIAAAIKGEHLPPPDPRAARTVDGDLFAWLPILFILALALGGTLRHALGM